MLVIRLHLRVLFLSFKEGTTMSDKQAASVALFAAAAGIALIVYGFWSRYAGSV
jgi:hypothetical protein